MIKNVLLLVILIACFCTCYTFIGDDALTNTDNKKLDEFKTPEVGTDIELELKDGRIIRGKCNKITSDKIYIGTTGVIVGYKQNEITSDSRCKFFKSAYDKKITDNILKLKKESESLAAQKKARDEAEAAKQEQEKAAEQALERLSAEDQYKFGLKYSKGEGVTKDDAKAVKWIRKAAEQGYAQAQSKLGECYDNGNGVATDKVEAAKWWRKAAEQGYASAQSNLGVYYYNGEGVAKDKDEAIKWWRKAADQGYASAQFSLGLCYDNGIGITKDLAEAAKWYRKAAEQGNASAQCNLGACYANGDGVRQDDAEAVKWYRKAAEQGNASAQRNLKKVLERNSPFADSNSLALYFKNKLSKEWQEGELRFQGEIKSTNVIVGDDFAEASMTVCSGWNEPQPKYWAWNVKFRFILNFGKWELESYSATDPSQGVSGGAVWRRYGNYLISDLPLNKE